MLKVDSTDEGRKCNCNKFLLRAGPRLLTPVSEWPAAAAAAAGLGDVIEM